MDKQTPLGIKKNKDITRRILPKIDTLLEWGVVKPGDIIVAKGDGRRRNYSSKWQCKCEWKRTIYADMVKGVILVVQCTNLCICCA